jgi:hypothetical protein
MLRRFALLIPVTVIVSAVVVARQTPAVKSFIATYTLMYYAADGTLFRSTSSSFARRSDGSTYLQIADLYPIAGKHAITEIIDTSNGTHVIVDPATQSKTTFHIGITEAQELAYGDEGDACPADLNLAQKADPMFGYTTVHYTGQFEHAGKREKWVIPELRCFPALEIITPSGAKSPHNEQRLTSLNVGPLAATLFSPPPDFVERSPMAVETLHMQTFQGEPFLGTNIAKGLDQQYFQSSNK